MGVEDRLRRLERSLSETTEPRRSETFTHLINILDELAHLRQSCAPRWTGPRNNTLVEGENIPRRTLGPGYTHRQLLELAVSRSVEARGVPAERAQDYLECMCKTGSKDLDTVVEEV